MQTCAVRFTAVFSFKIGIGLFLTCSSSSFHGISLLSSRLWPNLWFSFGTRPLVFFALMQLCCERLAPVVLFLVHSSHTCLVWMAIHGRSNAVLQRLPVEIVIFRRDVSFPKGKPMILPIQQEETEPIQVALGGLLGLFGAPKTVWFDVLGVHFGVAKHSTCGT